MLAAQLTPLRKSISPANFLLSASHALHTRLSSLSGWLSRLVASLMEIEDSLRVSPRQKNINFSVPQTELAPKCSLFLHKSRMQRDGLLCHMWRDVAEKWRRYSRKTSGQPKTKKQNLCIYF